MKGKVIKPRQFGLLRRLRDGLFRNWCRKRSHLLYHIVTPFTKSDVKINVAMRCRDDIAADWGHAWVTVDGIPFMEWNRRILSKSRTKVAESEKYIYWIFD